MCVKVPYQSHIRYSECGSTFAVPATHYCWVQMCWSMNYVFILQHYLRLLATCCNPTNHLKQMPYRDEYTLQVFKSPSMSVTSMLEVLWSQIKIHGKQTCESLCGKYTEYVKKNRTNHSSFCLMATYVVLLQKAILIWDGRNHLAGTLLIRKKQPRYTA